MPKITQDGRPMKVHTPLPEDDLLLAGFNGEEVVSSPGGFTLELVSEKPDIAAKDLLRKPMSVEILLPGGGSRYLHGVVRRFALLDRGSVLASYRAEIVPWLWFLSLASDNRIFQNLTVLEIVEQVFKDSSYTDFDNRCLKSYPKREYCVQYHESSYNFVSRLLEDEGIFYFFEHEKSKHTLVLADDPSKFRPCPGQDKAKMATSAAVAVKEDAVTGLQQEEQITTGKVTYSDFNPLDVRANLKRTVGNRPHEFYEYPGGYEKGDEGERYAGLTMEEFEAAHRILYGTSVCRAFTAGARFTLSEHFRKDLNATYSLLRVVHSASCASYLGGGDGSELDYHNSFVAIPHSVKFRPPADTPRPRVRGTQTAIVVGKAGEEIWTDKYGRVKVQFHWDRHGKKDENSGCWIRVSHPLAGKNWGMIHLPRIGQEVIVDFLEGDPDQPIITGRVYNSEQMPPYDLPANQTQSGIKTRSSKQGGAADFNELRFEDKKGAEEVLLHAQKVLKTEVEADEFRTVGNDRTTVIQHDETKTVKEGDEKITIEKGNQSLEINKGDQNVVIHGSQDSILETGDYGLKVQQGDHKTRIQQGSQELVIDMGDQTTKVQMGNVQTKVDMGNVDLKLGMGNHTTKLDLGKISMDALQGIELKVGQSSIVIDMMGVTIKGMMVKVEGQIQTDVKGLMVQVSGDAMLQAKGAITMIG